MITFTFYILCNLGADNSFNKAKLFSLVKVRAETLGPEDYPLYFTTEQVSMLELSVEGRMVACPIVH